MSAAFVNAVLAHNTSNMINDNRCPTCLSRGRRLRPLGSAAQVYNALVVGLERPDDNMECLLVNAAHNVCWECCSLMHKILAFHHQIEQARTELHSTAKTFSNLGLTMKVGFDLEIKYLGFECYDIVNLKSELDDTTKLEIYHKLVPPDAIEKAQVKEELEDIDTKIEIYNEDTLEPLLDISITSDSIDCAEPSTSRRSNRRKRSSTAKEDIRFVRELTMPSSRYIRRQLNEREMRAFRSEVSAEYPYADAPYRCVTCIKNFSHRYVLEKHNSDMHSEEVGEHACDICNVRFKSHTMMTNHRVNHYVLYTCSECEYRCTYVHTMNTHFSRAHRKGQQYRCKRCGETFDLLGKLKSHQRTHHVKKKCTCDYCGKQMEKFNLIRHIRLHTGQPTYTCEECGKVCRGDDSYRYHVKSQHGQKPIPENPDELYCVECDIHFKTSSNLKNHLLTTKRHAGDNMKIACDRCPSRFLTESARHFHVKRYHVEKKCDVCGMTLSSYYGWQTHVKRQHTTAEPEFTCHICNKTIKRKHRIEEHLRTHTGERPLVCAVCGDTFRQKSALYTHTKLKHRKSKREST